MWATRIRRCRVKLVLCFIMRPETVRMQASDDIRRSFLLQAFLHVEQ